MEGFIDLQRLIGRIVDVMQEQKEKMDDLHSMISALSPSQEVKKEDYDRLVARSAKEAESLKKASDSLPTPSNKRVKKDEASS